MLASEWGAKIGFRCEEALPALLKWGLAVESGPGDALMATPLPVALQKLDEVWDSFFSFAVSRLQFNFRSRTALPA